MAIIIECVNFYLVRFLQFSCCFLDFCCCCLANRLFALDANAEQVASFGSCEQMMRVKVGSLNRGGGGGGGGGGEDGQDGEDGNGATQGTLALAERALARFTIPVFSRCIGRSERGGRTRAEVAPEGVPRAFALEGDGVLVFVRGGANGHGRKSPTCKISIMERAGQRPFSDTIAGTTRGEAGKKRAPAQTPTATATQLHHRGRANCPSLTDARLLLLHCLSSSWSHVHLAAFA